MIEEKWLQGADDLTGAYQLRRLVFIEEQGASEAEELDNKDESAAHLVMYDAGEPVATGRIIIEGNVCFLGRICVRRNRRRTNLGTHLTRLLIRQAFDLGYAEQIIHAQIQARGFYERLGFTAFGEPYLEAGIPHVSMRHTGTAELNEPGPEQQPSNRAQLKSRHTLDALQTT
jgi:ElaA protein